MNFHFPKQLEHPLIIKEIISRKTVKLDFFYFKDGEVHKSYSVVTKTFRTEKSNFKMLVISTNTFIFSCFLRLYFPTVFETFRWRSFNGTNDPVQSYLPRVT